MLRRRLAKSRTTEVDPPQDAVADEWKQEATLQELERVMWRVGLLTATASELVEDIDAPGSDLSPPPAVVSDARELVKVIDVHERERSLPPRALLSIAQLCGLALAVYAIFIDELTNVGLLMVALGLLFIRRALTAQGPWHG